MATFWQHPDHLAAVVLAAGAGVRLRPLTLVRPKALCPVGGVPLVDHAVGRARAVTAVGGGELPPLPTDARRPPRGPRRPPARWRTASVLGTAGALGRLRPWIDGRPVLVLNADTWSEADLRALVDGWDGVRPRLLCGPARPGPPATWGDLAYAGAALLPWSQVSAFPDEPGGLWEVSWRHLRPGADLDLVVGRRPVRRLRHAGPLPGGEPGRVRRGVGDRRGGGRRG